MRMRSRRHGRSEAVPLSRKSTWFWMLVGGAIYQSLKALMGFSANWNTLSDSAFRSAGTLFVHWLGCRFDGAR
jgi:hypothetical protein